MPFIKSKGLSVAIDLSGVVLLLGAMVFYFGKLIGDVQVERYDKRSYQVQGAMFIFNFILLPSLVLAGVHHYMYQVLAWDISGTTIFVSLLFISAIYAGQNTLNKLLLRYDIHTENRYTRKWESQLENVQETTGRDISGIFESKFNTTPRQWFTQTARFGRNLFEAKKMRFFSALTILLLLYHGLTVGGGFAIATASLAFIGLSGIAFATGYEQAHYPTAIIRTEDGREIKGKILSFDDYLTVWTDDDKRQIKKEHIADIIESKWQDREPYHAKEPDILEESQGVHGSFLKIDLERDHAENIDNLRIDLSAWTDNELFEEFEDEECDIDLAIVYHFSDEEKAWDADKLFKLVKPVSSSLENHYKDDKNRHLFQDDEQIKQILVRRQEAQEHREKDYLTISFRKHSEKPMKLISKTVI